ncbi:NAD(P)/FAD-dependent oxidoreductase [Acinetobacter haemolyticus]|uniref:NAD(P)/FAD-dependent oxidoreductase n=1 Tax=Acinetobacter haemolyticus TaxID=29430 RepID=UPI0013728B71|nr:NAD(P)/FAD-dependent oxidoreductase [Acinetobacter haemolyticus]NAR87798.1 NAD(P)/FAD-dependent oxidoreductase [Acinetobacter haemolyticus]
MHNIVVIGGGAGGLELVTKLSQKDGISLTLVDAKLTHIWKPLLHEVASGSLNLAENEVSYLIHSHQHNYNYVYGSLINIDKNKKSVDIEIISGSDPKIKCIRTLKYDTLILSLGSKSNDFNIPGVKDHCYFLDSQEQANKIHDKIFMSYLDMKQQVIPIASDYHVAIIGAGATGVELVSELINLKNKMAETLFKESSQIRITFTLIDSSERILSGLSSKISEEVEKKLVLMGINILKNTRVTSIDADKIYFSDGSELVANLKIWTAGIKAPQVLENLKDFEKDNIHRLKVYATLQTYSDPNIFALGDCAHCKLDATQPPLGARAQVASQQAEFLATNLMNGLSNKTLPMFKFVEKGSIVSLGQKQAIGEVFSELNIYGKLARTTYDFLYRLHQVNIHGIQQTAQLHKRESVTKNLLKKIKLY